MNNTGLPTWVKVANGSKSFPCPHCGGNTAVGDSRPSHNGIRRRRYCKCGHRFTSYEVISEEFPQDYIQHISAIATQAGEIEVRLSALFLAITATLVAAEITDQRATGVKHGSNKQQGKPDNTRGGGS